MEAATRLRDRLLTLCAEDSVGYCYALRAAAAVEVANEMWDAATGLYMRVVRAANV